MYTKPPPGNTDRPLAGRRRLLAWLGGMGVAGFAGATVVPLTDLADRAKAAPATGDGVAGQRLVYAHREAAEQGVGGHIHSDDLYVQADHFARPGALDGVLAYPEHLVGEESYAVLLHRFTPDSFEAPTAPALTADGFVAYGATCPRCGTLLRWSGEAGENGLVVCPYQGCQFDPRRGGRAVTGPADTPLTQVGIRLASAGGFELTTDLAGGGSRA